MTTKNVRVAVFAPHFAEYSVRLANALSEGGPVLLVMDRDDREEECPAELVAQARKRVRMLDFRSRTRFARYFALIKVPLGIAWFRPDIIHLQEQGDIVTARIVRILRPFFRFALTIHDPVPHSGADAAYARRKAAYLRLLRQTAVLYHVHGEYCRGLVSRHIDGSKPCVNTAHGILLDPPAELMREPEPGRLLLFGRMQAYKGLERALDAADMLTRRGCAFHLVLAGRGPELDRLADRIRTVPNVSVISKYLTPDEAVQEFQRSIAVVAPYSDATQSGVIAVAFGNGRPAVVTRVGGLVDSVRDELDGLMVPPEDSVALADALERLINEPGLRERLTAGSRESRDGRFSWPMIAKALRDAYPSVF